MATYYGSYVSSAFRSRADVTTSQTNTDFTISVTGYCQMADYYHDSGENFFRKIVIGSDTPNRYVTASTAYFSGGGTYGVGSSSRKYTRTHAAQSIEVGVAIHNDGVYTGWSTADSYARTTVTVPAKPSYAVSFNANGGSGAPSGQTKWYGETLTLSSTKPTRTGYTFKNWNTKSDGSGTSYAAGASYTANAALALYAQWAINTWTVSYNANGGSSTPASQTKTYNVALTLRGAISRSNASATGYKVTYDANGGSCSTSSATAARTTKYTFYRWNTKSDGSGTAYAAGASYTGNAALALYATWTSSTTTSAVTLPTPSRTGYAFDGWYTAASGGTRVGGAGGSYTPTGAVTLHAHWTQNTWTVSYAANGGSSTPASQTKLYGQALTLRPAISRSNATATYTVSYSANYSGGTNPSSGTATKTTKYAFNGWKASNGTVYAASGSYTANAATTMTAQWTSSASTTSVTLPTPTRTGHTFGGWYRESACTNKVGNGGASYTPTASIQLFAKWTINTWTVSYNANGGTGAPASQTKTYGQTLTLSSTRPARSGYTFLGWSTNSTGTGTAYAPGATYSTNASATLYAVWVGVQVTSLTAYRSNSSGTRSDSGTYGYISAGYKAIGTIAGTVTLTATANGVDVSSQLTNRSGSKTATADYSATATGAVGGSYSEGTAVNVLATATFSVSYGGATYTATAQRIATIPKVFRLLDGLAGGTGLAIGTVATLANTLEIGIQTVARSSIRIFDSRFLIGATLQDNVYSLALGHADRNGENVGYSQARQLTDGTIGYGITAINKKSDNSTVTNSIATLVGTDGTRSYQVSDAAAFRKAINAMACTDAESQNARLTSLGAEHQHWAVRANVTNALNSHYEHDTGLCLSDVGAFGYDFTAQSTMWNGITDKTEVYKTSTASSIITAASGITIAGATYASWGKVAMVSIGFSGVSASTGTKTIGTMASGMRPAYNQYECGCNTAQIMWAQIDVSGSFTANFSATPSSAATYYVRFIYILA